MDTGTVIVLPPRVLAALVLVLVLRGERAPGGSTPWSKAPAARRRRWPTASRAQEARHAGAAGKRLADMTKSMSEGLIKSTDRTVADHDRLQKRLAVIDEAQKNITELSNQVVGLQDILANKQARGAFGEIQLQIW